MISERRVLTEGELDEIVSYLHKPVWVVGHSGVCETSVVSHNYCAPVGGPITNEWLIRFVDAQGYNPVDLTVQTEDVFSTRDAAFGELMRREGLPTPDTRTRADAALRPDLLGHFDRLARILANGRRFAEQLPGDVPRAEVFYEHATKTIVFEWDGMTVGVGRREDIMWHIGGSYGGEATLGDTAPDAIVAWLKAHPNAGG